MLPVFDGLRNITLASVAFRLILSTLCGGIVGMEREFKRRSAGFRTHILICLGAAMTTLTSEFWLVYMRYYLDAARLGAGVVAGMGFIGAGTPARQGTDDSGGAVDNCNRGACHRRGFLRGGAFDCRTDPVGGTAVFQD